MNPQGSSPDHLHGLQGAQFCGVVSREPSLLACTCCTHGAVGAQGPVCTGPLVVLEFQGEGSRLCGRGGTGF
jgi:hypothetical protein